MGMALSSNKLHMSILVKFEGCEIPTIERLGTFFLSFFFISLFNYIK